MKIFKSKSILTDEIKQSLSIGETVIMRLHDESPYVQFTVLQCVTDGSFSYQGGFNTLKKAVQFAESIENPQLRDNQFQILELSSGYKLIIYYNQIEREVIDYIEAMDYEYKDIDDIPQSDLSVIFLNQKKVKIKESIEDIHESNMIAFGNYLLSEERNLKFANLPNQDKEILRERLSKVHHSDLVNFKELSIGAIKNEWLENENPFIQVKDRLR